MIRPHRDPTLIRAVVRLVRRAARDLAFLVCVEGRASDVTALARAFRDPVRTGRAGRPRRVPTAVRLLGPGIKPHAGRGLVSITRRVVRGTTEAITAVLTATGTGTGMNTASIARLNATSRSRLASLVRRGRGLAHQVETLELGMYLVGCVYNLCTEHCSLRVPIAGGEAKWRGRTPAMAARWTDRVWSLRELLSFRPPTLVHG